MLNIRNKIDSMLSELKSDLASEKYATNAHFPSKYDLAERFGVLSFDRKRFAFLSVKMIHGKT